ncbi:MAG: hypothetical protein Q7T11_09395, partial [Deltaproteobacteria bacterium]|nr:hypothetical protein [Deltaproteobacteria bacterium]
MRFLKTIFLIAGIASLISLPSLAQKFSTGGYLGQGLEKIASVSEGSPDKGSFGGRVSIDAKLEEMLWGNSPENKLHAWIQKQGAADDKNKTGDRTKEIGSLYQNALASLQSQPSPLREREPSQDACGHDCKQVCMEEKTRPCRSGCAELLNFENILYYLAHPFDPSAAAYVAEQERCNKCDADAEEECRTEGRLHACPASADFTACQSQLVNGLACANTCQTEFCAAYPVDCAIREGLILVKLYCLDQCVDFEELYGCYREAHEDCSSGSGGSQTEDSDDQQCATICGEAPRDTSCKDGSGYWAHSTCGAYRDRLGDEAQERRERAQEAQENEARRQRVKEEIGRRHREVLSMMDEVDALLREMRRKKAEMAANADLLDGEIYSEIDAKMNGALAEARDLPPRSPVFIAAGDRLRFYNFLWEDIGPDENPATLAALADGNVAMAETKLLT